MNAALKAAWVLTAFVVVAGVVLWLVTGRAVFAAFLVLGLLTAGAALMTGRTQPPGRGGPPGRAGSKEDTRP